MLIDPNEKTFDAGGSFLQVGDDYILYVDGGKEEAAEKDKFFFKDLDRITVVRSKTTGRVRAIDYEMKGQLFPCMAFRIDGCGDAEMEEIAASLESRTKGFPIKWVEKRGDRFPFLFLAAHVALLGLVVFIVWRYPDMKLGKYDYGVRLALSLLGSIPLCIAVYRALFRRKQT